MIIPIRCFTCGKPVAQLWEDYQVKVGKGTDPGKAMDSLGLDRYCCRRMLLTNAELVDSLLLYTR